MRVLVTGANGFIGCHVVAALRGAGHEVVSGVRRARPGRRAEIECDFARDLSPEIWGPRLQGVDAVVNCAGILRERGADTFERVHVKAPAALYDACVLAGVGKVVQVSALGHPADGAFVASKHAGDAYLQTLPLDWTALRPSVVYSPAGSYGGTSLLRALAALPFRIPVPGDGRQPVQPICAEDLARLVVRLLERPAGARRVLEAVGPEVIGLADLLTGLRIWLGLPPARLIRVPLWVVRPAAQLGELLGRGPLGLTMYRMLQRGNTGAAGAADRLARAAGFRPRALAEVSASTPSLVQDRWHARLYFLAPALRLSLALVWILSGAVGLGMDLHRAEALLAPAVPAGAVPALVYSAAVLDIGLGAAVLIRRWLRPALVLMLAVLLGYTLFLGVALPGLWLDPLGGLVKNLALLPAVLVMLVLSDPR